jgi:hypothetical protein
VYRPWTINRFFILFIVMVCLVLGSIPPRQRACPAVGSTAQMTDYDLQSWYMGLNETYFNGKLPPADIRFANLEPENKLGWTNKTADAGFVIRIDRGWNPVSTQVIETEMHEMCHVATWDEVAEHGDRWQACMHRLVELGAWENLW